MCIQLDVWYVKDDFACSVDMFNHHIKIHLFIIIILLSPSYVYIKLAKTDLHIYLS